MPIYTRTGDRGKTTLADGKKVSKSNLMIECLGSIDELNSILGVVLSSKYQVLSIKKELVKIQNDLLSIGSNLANPSLTHSSQLITLNLRVEEFERLIDKMTEQMPKLNNFILPGGEKAGAMMHLARAVCRRVERRIVKLNQKSKIKNQKSAIILIYFNRLSDLLFTMARFANLKEKKKEIICKPAS